MTNPRSKSDLIAMAHRGGEANRLKHLDDPTYFQRIGRLGAAARKRKRLAKGVTIEPND